MRQLKLIFLVIAVIITKADTCIFKPAVNKEPNSGQFLPFNDVQFDRPRSNSSCVCGKDYAGVSGRPDTVFRQKWILHIHLKMANSRTRRCIGTIVNSNMVITSHRCLQKEDRLSVYDVIRANNGENSSLATAKEITLSNGTNLLSPYNINISVKTVIYSVRFAYDHAFEMAPESDVAILVVEYDFTNRRSGSPLLYPICLPTLNLFETPQLINREAYYQGVLASNETNHKFNILVSNYSTVTTAEACNKRGGLNVKPGNNQTLCLMFTQPSPTVEGGPLRINVNRMIEGGPKRSYLIGIATWVQKTGMNAGHKYAYFANVNSFVKYIEHHAKNHNSKWCSMPNPDDKHWPWEGYCGKVDSSLQCTCGYRDSKHGRIVGGENGSIGEFPWLARFTLSFYVKSATKKNAGTGGKSCGGSLINDRMILTAAHCFVRSDLHPQEESFNLHNMDGNFADYFIYLHSYHSDETIDTAKGIPVIEREALNVLFHPGYPDEDVAFRTDFDIALIILKEPLILGKDTSSYPRLDPICLPEKHYLEKIIGKNVTVAGWGAEGWEKGAPLGQSYIVKKLDIPIRHLNECISIDKEQGYRFDIPTDTKFCASSLSPWQDAGQGDSGGPLMHRKDNGRMVQVGIVSYGRLPREAAADKAEDKTTTYYANVEAFLPYINYYSNKYKAKFCNS